MFQKLMWFLFLLFIAAVIGIWFPNRYTVIECENADKVCKTYHVNSVLKTKNLVRSVNVSSKRGFSVSVLGVGINNLKYLYCSEYQKKATNNGKEKFITTYLLVPINMHNILPMNAIPFPFYSTCIFLITYIIVLAASKVCGKKASKLLGFI